MYLLKDESTGNTWTKCFKRERNISQRVPTSFADDRCTDLSSVHFPTKHADMILSSNVTAVEEAAPP